MKITLKEAIEMMNKIKENDYNDEYEVFFKNTPDGKVKIVVESKLIEIKNE